MHDRQDKGQVQAGDFGAVAHGVDAGHAGFEPLVGDDAALAGDAGRLRQGRARAQTDRRKDLVGDDLAAVGQFQPVARRRLPDAFDRRAEIELDAPGLQTGSELPPGDFRQQPGERPR